MIRSLSFVLPLTLPVHLVHRTTDPGCCVTGKTVCLRASCHANFPRIFMAYGGDMYQHVMQVPIYDGSWMEWALGGNEIISEADSGK